MSANNLPRRSHALMSSYKVPFYFTRRNDGVFNALQKSKLLLIPCYRLIIKIATNLCAPLTDSPMYTCIPLFKLEDKEEASNSSGDLQRHTISLFGHHSLDVNATVVSYATMVPTRWSTGPSTVHFNLTEIFIILHSQVLSKSVFN